MSTDLQPCLGGFWEAPPSPFSEPVEARCSLCKLGAPAHLVDRDDVFNAALEEAAKVCEEEADAIDGRIPDATGGKFAKKFAANGLRGAAALIRARRKGMRGQSQEKETSK